MFISINNTSGQPHAPSYSYTEPISFVPSTIYPPYTYPQPRFANVGLFAVGFLIYFFLSRRMLDFIHVYSTYYWLYVLSLMFSRLGRGFLLHMLTSERAV